MISWLNGKGLRNQEISKVRATRATEGQDAKSPRTIVRGLSVGFHFNATLTLLIIDFALHVHGIGAE